MAYDQIRINGALLGWGSIVTEIDDDPYQGYTDISFADKLTVEKVFGQSRAQKPLGRTKGKYDVDDAKVTMLAASARSLRQKLASKSDSGTAYGSVEFTISVQGVEKATDQVIDVLLVGCRVVGVGDTWAEGEGVLKEEMTISVMSILRDGLSLYEE
jgi:hypothetical protein